MTIRILITGGAGFLGGNLIRYSLTKRIQVVSFDRARFDHIKYAPGFPTEKEVRSVNVGYTDLRETVERFNPQTIQQEFNRIADGEKGCFIGTPSAGLWTTEEKSVVRHDPSEKISGVYHDEHY